MKAVTTLVVAIVMSVLMTGTAQAMTPANLEKVSKPFVHVHDHHASERGAGRLLTRSQVKRLERALSDYNKAQHSTAKRKPNAKDAISGSGPASAKGPDCYWSWRWNAHWYGWTYWVNDCLARWEDKILENIAAGSTTVAGGEYLYTQVTEDAESTTFRIIAAALVIGYFAIEIQMGICETAGYSGIGFGEIMWTAPYDYC